MQNPDASPDPDRLVLVFAASSSYEGFLAQGLLQSEGIPTFTKGEGEGPYRTGPMYLWVPEAFEIQARLLLEEAGRGDLRTEDEGGSAPGRDMETGDDQEAADEEV
jgi:Putative prokaryotic signal transducing protein